MAVRLFIGNLPYDATEADLRAHFAPVAEPSHVAMPVDRETGRPRGFAFVGIDIWDRDEERVAEFLRKTGASYIIGVDPRGELAVEFGVTGIPEKYFIDPSGVIVRKFVGPMNEARLSAILDELLARQTSLGERAFRMMAEQYDVRQPGRYAYSSPNLAHGL